jgi:hypothetical protein
MSRLSKILVALSMLCYIATSSVAAVHALPMVGNLDNSPSTFLNAKIPLSLKVGSFEVVSFEGASGEMAESMMPCHQTSGSSADKVKASNACKIFCSAIGHALISVELPDVVSKLAHTSPRSRADSLLTRQTSVDHQPPK